MVLQNFIFVNTKFCQIKENDDKMIEILCELC